jgi:tRNA nucleotidyltransferase/poly(A) polymerase
MQQNILEMLDRAPIKMKMHLQTPADLGGILDAFMEAGEELYVVGGAVRDTLLGKIPKDYDLATGAEPQRVIDIVSKDPSHRIDLTGKAFGVVRVRTVGGEEYEIATFRNDIGEGRRPDSVEFTTIEDDVNRRDLTINALFYDLTTGEVVDYVGGIEDVKNGVIRAVGDPALRFREDKLRILRAVRFAARLGSDLDETTASAIKRDNDLSGVSPERIHDEFAKAVKSAIDGQHLLGLIGDLGLWPQIFPGLEVDAAPASKHFDVQVALLLWGNDPGAVAKVLRKMKYTSDEAGMVQFLLNLPGIVASTSPKLKKEFKRLRVPPEKLEEFALAVGMPEKFVQGFLEFVQRSPTLRPQELMAKGLKGPQIGQAMHSAEVDVFKSLTESFLRMNILLEKTFADMGVPKNKWEDVPAEELAVHRKEVDIDDEVLDLISTAYAPIGGNLKIKKPEDLPGGYEFFDTVDVDEDPQPDGVIFGKYKDGRLKIGGRGHDGADGKNPTSQHMFDLLKRKGTFVETSGAPAWLAFKAGVNAVTDEAKVRAILKKPIEWLGPHPNRNFGPDSDGWYYRKIGKSGAKHLKIMMGNV